MFQYISSNFSVETLEVGLNIILEVNLSQVFYIFSHETRTGFRRTYDYSFLIFCFLILILSFDKIIFVRSITFHYWYIDLFGQISVLYFMILKDTSTTEENFLLLFTCSIGEEMVLKGHMPFTPGETLGKIKYFYNLVTDKTKENFY